MTDRHIDPANITQADADALTAKLATFAESLPDQEWAVLGAILAQARAGAPDTAGHIAVGEPSPNSPGGFFCGTPPGGPGLPSLPGVPAPFWVGPAVVQRPQTVRGL
jgi:hypothetical protein